MDTITGLVREIVGVEVDDGVIYDPDALTAGVIREADQYGGVRLNVPARIDRARAPLRIDISVGDPVTPSPVRIDFPALLGGAFAVHGYPLETVLAEKLVTMIDRDETNTRDRDFADVALLTARHSVDAITLNAALTATAQHRGVVLRPLAATLTTIAATRQDAWEQFRARAGLEAVLPGSMLATIARVVAFADPILTGGADGQRWHPEISAWRPDVP